MRHLAGSKEIMEQISGGEMRTNLYSEDRPSFKYRGLFPFLMMVPDMWTINSTVQYVSSLFITLYTNWTLTNGYMK